MPEKHTIFISHASKDEPIVTPFVDKILNVGLEISRDKIFYTSNKDTGIRSGEDFKKTIKDKMLSATAIIQIITPNYKQSEVCLNEMGAAWVLSDNVIPFILEPVNFDSVGFLHNTTQLLRLNNEGDLFQFHDDHPELYENRRIKTSNYHKQVKEYIEILSNGRFRFNSFY